MVECAAGRHNEARHGRGGSTQVHEKGSTQVARARKLGLDPSHHTSIADHIRLGGRRSPFGIYLPLVLCWARYM